MKKIQKLYKIKFNFLNFIIVFLTLIPLDLYRFWLRDHTPLIGGFFNFWGNVFDTTLIATIMTYLTLKLINIKFRDIKALRLSLLFISLFFAMLANFFSESKVGQQFIIANVGSYLKNVSDIWDFIVAVLVAIPLVLTIIKLKAVDLPTEKDYDFSS